MPVCIQTLIFQQTHSEEELRVASVTFAPLHFYT